MLKMKLLSIGRNRVILIISAAVLIAAGLITATLLFIFLAPNTRINNDDTYLYIRNDDKFAEVMDQIKVTGILKNNGSFRVASKILQYDSKVKPGRYRINDNLPNILLIKKLRSGNQDPVQLKFNNIRTKEQLAGRLSKQVMADSASIVDLLSNDAFLSDYQFNSQTAVSVFIPNTYEVFWNLDAEMLFQRMKKEYDRFWNEERLAQATQIPFTQVEVITLASIIEEETNKKHEYPVIAGLYINRIRKGMPLQACPTVRFALNDFTIKRVLFRHIAFESPYNTYQNAGLPPGPIRLPSVVCIDAVLNYQKHDYLFMSAKETLNGEHHFAVTGAEHMRNARKYQQALNKLNIR
jgi:UPF0755 protein